MNESIRPQSSLRVRSTALRFTAFLWLLLFAGCATNPVTGNREFVLVSEGQEVSMGQEGAQQVEASIGLVDDAGLQSYVRNIGMRLAAKSERPNLPRSEEHTSELQSLAYLVCRLLLEKKKHSRLYLCAQPTLEC